MLPWSMYNQPLPPYIPYSQHKEATWVESRMLKCTSLKMSLTIYAQMNVALFSFFIKLLPTPGIPSVANSLPDGDRQCKVSLLLLSSKLQLSILLCFVVQFASPKESTTDMTIIHINYVLYFVVCRIHSFPSQNRLKNDIVCY